MSPRARKYRSSQLEPDLCGPIESANGLSNSGFTGLLSGMSHASFQSLILRLKIIEGPRAKSIKFYGVLIKSQSFSALIRKARNLRDPKINRGNWGEIKKCLLQQAHHWMAG